MKKNLTPTLILAAAMAAATGVANAESTVELYGLIDLGYMYDHDEARGATAQSIDSGNVSGSRFGLRGAEDLGSGWKAVFQLENGFNADNGTYAQDGRMFGRWAYVGLANDQYGELRLGRQWVLGREWGAAASPFGIAWSRAAVGTTFGYNDGDYGASGIADNMVMYRSPKIAGFEAAVGYSYAVDQADEEFATRDNDRMLTAGLRYGKGPLRVALTYEHLYVNEQRNTRTRQVHNSTNWQLGGSYDFEVVRVYAGVGRVNDANAGPSRNFEKDNAWTAGVKVPVGGAGSILASWQQSTNSKIRVAALGYDYELSKRTDLYAFVNHSETRDFATDEDMGRTQVSVGMRHRF